MKIRNIGNRGTLFTFEDEISIYMIHGNDRIFLCDTHLGPVSMEFVKKYIDENGWMKKEMVIFNSHSDWDHVWGNCAFPGSIIIAHKSCRERMQEIGEFELEKLWDMHQGHVELILPNLTFGSSLTYEEEDIQFIHAPGHTSDSSICWDKQDSVLFIGDLAEDPIPYASYEDLDAYIQTLEYIESFPAKTIITAHSGIVGPDLLTANMAYIRALSQNVPVDLADDALPLHDYNVKNRMILSYTNKIKQRQKDSFNYKSFKEEFWKSLHVAYEDLNREFHYITSTSYEDLENAFIDYIAALPPLPE